jgi:hypothetical protein
VSDADVAAQLRRIQSLAAEIWPPLPAATADEATARIIFTCLIREGAANYELSAAQWKALCQLHGISTAKAEKLLRKFGCKYSRRQALRVT